MAVLRKCGFSREKAKGATVGIKESLGVCDPDGGGESWGVKNLEGELNLIIGRGRGLVRAFPARSVTHCQSSGYVGNHRRV